MNLLPANTHPAYHAHVYFDASSIERARELCEQASQHFSVTMGRVHERPVGPHPCWSCQLAFSADQFDPLTRWLEKERGDLTVLVHALSGDVLADHTTHAGWLGAPATLKLEVFNDSLNDD